VGRGIILCPLVHIDVIPKKTSSSLGITLRTRLRWSGRSHEFGIRRKGESMLLLQTHIDFPRFLPIFPDFLE
jgi:hypothetical protein